MFYFSSAIFNQPVYFTQVYQYVYTDKEMKTEPIFTIKVLKEDDGWISTLTSNSGETYSTTHSPAATYVSALISAASYMMLILSKNIEEKVKPELKIGFKSDLNSDLTFDGKRIKNKGKLKVSNFDVKITSTKNHHMNIQALKEAIQTLSRETNLDNPSDIGFETKNLEEDVQLVFKNAAGSNFIHNQMDNFLDTVSYDIVVEYPVKSVIF